MAKLRDAGVHEAQRPMGQKRRGILPAPGDGHGFGPIVWTAADITTWRDTFSILALRYHSEGVVSSKDDRRLWAYPVEIAIVHCVAAQNGMNTRE